MIKNRREKAFTILESILALAVFGMMIIALLTALNSAGKGADEIITVNKIIAEMRTLIDMEINKSSVKEKTEQIEKNGTKYIVVIEKFEVENEAGENLRDLYKLAVKARTTEGQKFKAETLIYKSNFMTIKTR